VTLSSAGECPANPAFDILRWEGDGVMGFATGPIYSVISNSFGVEENQRGRMEKRKVIIRKLNGEILKGYAEPSLDPVSGKESIVTIASLTEESICVPKSEIKALFFVRKFSGNKDYSEVKFFESQPRIDGLWVRVFFFDNEAIEGIVANSINFLIDDGFYLKPPDPNSNNRMMYIVKSALKDFTVLGVQYSKGNLADYYERFMSSKDPEGSPPAAAK
jgi:hypothetical protein